MQERRGTHVSGVDVMWWAELLGSVQQILPGRFRGLPPLFYIPAIAGIVWGGAFVLFRVSGLVVPPGMMLEPRPPLPSKPLDIFVTLAAAVGMLQGVGTLWRRRWGLWAAYVWFSLTSLHDFASFASDKTRTAADVPFLLLGTGFCLAFILYYHNRRGWFGTSARP